MTSSNDLRLRGAMLIALTLFACKVSEPPRRNADGGGPDAQAACVREASIVLPGMHGQDRIIGATESGVL